LLFEEIALLYIMVWQWFATGRWFSPYTQVSSTISV